MALGVLIEKKRPRTAAYSARRWALTGLALTSASCVPVSISQGPPAIGLAPAPIVAATSAAPAAPVELSEARPAAPNPADATYAFEGRTALDRLRSLDCLAQAIYYEAGSESEDGQRAVAQVVLNRVRHPAWPNSVCGVVYQGPMRAGGGCQFTFTCDGSLMRRPAGLTWLRARELAAEALAGYVHAPVGLSTHYHANYVFPTWAPRLQPMAAIGAHRFYRLPGQLGEGAAFSDQYAGAEPLPRPAFTLLRFRPASTGLAGLVGRAQPAAYGAPGRTNVPAAEAPSAPDPAEVMVRDEYRQSGQWRDDAPAAITGQ